MVRDYLLATDTLLRDIITEVGQKHGFTYYDMVSARRPQKIVEARFEAYWRCARETGSSYPKIGRAFGDRDHTTIIHGVKKYEMRRAQHGAA